MEDKAIVDLYWQRSEQAIAETDAKYGRLCRSIAGHVLFNREDAEESVNDTYLAAWNAMPPHRPAVLAAFLGKLARRTAITRWYALSAQKRGGGQIPLVLEELGDCCSPGPGPEETAMGREACTALNRFLTALPETERKVFLRRYFFLDSVEEICQSFRFSEAKVRSMLRRTRMKLKNALMKEGYL